MHDLLPIIILLSASLYALATVFYWLCKQAPSYLFHSLAFLSNLFLIAVNWIENGYVPFISMYQVLTFVGACFTLCYLYMHFINKSKWMAPYFTLCSGLVMVGVFFMEKPLIWLRPPALQSPLFIPHVLSYMLSYPLLAVSFLFCCALMLRLRAQKRRMPVSPARHKDPGKISSEITKYESGIYHVVLLAFPFMTAGMFLGALWANESWGHYWSWDAKENWALITWLLYAIYLHIYKNVKLRKYRNLFIIAGMIALLMTLFGINLFAVPGVHTYS